MSIVYSLVYQHSLIQAESPTLEPAYPSLARELLGSISTPSDVDEERMTVTVDDSRAFHYIATSSGIVVLCLADTAAGRRIPFAFLYDVLSHVYSKSCVLGQGEEKSPLVYLLENKLEYWNNNPTADKFRLVQDRVGQVKEIMVQNIEKLTRRAIILDNLQQRTEELKAQSQQFKTRARGVRNTLFWQRVKWALLLSFFIVFILALVLVLIVY